MKKRITVVISILVGILFLASGFGKAMNAGRFGSLIAQYGFTLLRHTAPIIIAAEILTGLCLILRIRTKIMALVSLAMLVVFTLAYAYGYFVNNIYDCGCFGSMNVGINGPVFTFVRNFALIGLSIFIWLNAPATEKKIADWKLIVTGFILLPLIFLTGFTFRTPVGFWERSKVEVHPWENKNVAETLLPKYVKIVPDSSYLVAFISYDCVYCWNSVANFKQIRESGMIDKVVAYVPNRREYKPDAKNLIDSHRNTFIEYFGDSVVSGEIGYDPALLKYITRSPTFFYITNDTVRKVIEGVLPSTLTFQKMYIKKK